MPAASFDDLAPLQRAALEALWLAGEATVHDLRDRINPDGTMAYTSVLSALQNLEAGGWVSRTAAGRRHVYRPARTREEAGRGAVRRLLDKAFGGDPFLLFQRLLEDDSLTPSKLADLRRELDRRRAEVEGRGDGA